MQRIEHQNINVSAGNARTLNVVLGTWAIMIVTGLIWFFFDDDIANPFREYYLLPWCFVTAVIACIPPAYLYYKGKFDLFHPLIFASWIYIIPAFVVGGVIISFGLSDPYYLSYIQDPEYELPLTLIYISIGYIGLVAGFALPIGRNFGQRLQNKLPKWEWTLKHTWIAGWLLILAGTLVNIIGFVNGLLGFQKFEGVEAFDGVIMFLLTMFFEGYFLLWYALFRTPRKDASYLVTFLFLIMMIPLRMAIMGNRGSIFVCILPIAFAYVVSGQRVTIKHGFIFGLLMAVGVFIGMIYGTSFRNIKGMETRLAAGDYIGQIGNTLDYISRKDLSLIMQDGGTALADRLENLSSVANVVSNYEKLAPYEKAYGLDNNIVRDAWTSLIPRFLWPEKPLTSDSHAYSDLYFDYEANSFAVTLWGDLLRNFGPWGIPIGMALLGIVLRVIHVSLWQQSEGHQWRSAAYYLVLTQVSYEAFYATLLPSLMRITLVLIVTLYLANLITKRASRSG